MERPKDGFARRKRSLLVLGTGAGIVAAYFLMAGAGGPGVPGEAKRDGSAMADKAEGDAARQPPAIPPIDLRAHGATETATFAMG